MTKKSTCFVFTILALCIAVTGCETMHEEPQQAESAPPAPTCLEAGSPSDPNRLAQGAQFDSVEACMARIPCEASASQRMLAEESCKATFKAETRKDFDALEKNRRDPDGPIPD